MNRRLPFSTKGFLFAFGCLALGSGVFADEPETVDAAGRQYWADISLFSFCPGDELATYRSHGGGGVGPHGTLGTGAIGKGRDFNVTIRGSVKSHRFMAAVEVGPEPEDKKTPAQTIEYDLSDFEPRTLEITRDDDGRVYRLNLNPSVLVHPTTQFKSSELRLENWSFPGSPVILNDQDYLGELSMSGGQLAHGDIPGLARIEFSLLHLKGASPIGKLADGVINITHKNGTTLRIANVKNGANAVALPGGPYIVWVRWNKPTQSLDEYRQELKKTIASLKKQVSDGDLVPRPGVLERLEKMLDSGRVGLINEFGLGGISPDDLADPE